MGKNIQSMVKMQIKIAHALSECLCSISRSGFPFLFVTNTVSWKKPDDSLKSWVPPTFMEAVDWVINSWLSSQPNPSHCNIWGEYQQIKATCLSVCLSLSLLVYTCAYTHLCMSLSASLLLFFTLQSQINAFQKLTYEQKLDPCSFQ